jgi:hypothetical protein
MLIILVTLDIEMGKSTLSEQLEQKKSKFLRPNFNQWLGLVVKRYKASIKQQGSD